MGTNDLEGWTATPLHPCSQSVMVPCSFTTCPFIPAPSFKPRTTHNFVIFPDGLWLTPKPTAWAAKELELALELELRGTGEQRSWLKEQASVVCSSSFYKPVIRHLATAGLMYRLLHTYCHSSLCSRGSERWR